MTVLPADDWQQNADAASMLYRQTAAVTPRQAVKF